MFMYNFLFSNIIISILVLLVLLFKAAVGSRISPKIGYLMWLCIIAAILGVLTPNIGTWNFETANIVRNTAVNNISSALRINGTNANDLYISVNKNKILPCIWLLGVIVNIIVIVLSQIGLDRLPKIKCENKMFDKWCKTTGVKANLYICGNVNSPLSFGIISPAVVIPVHILDSRHFEFIILHELIHHKHKDIIVNYFALIVKVFYWFNPFVYIMYNRLKQDMEIYCDYSVIEYTGNNAGYGCALIETAAYVHRYKTADYFGAVKNNIRERVKRIACYSHKYPLWADRSTAFAIAALNVFLFFTMNAFGCVYDVNPHTVKSEIVDLQSYFGEYNGCFVLYSLKSDSYKIYNEAMANKRASPNSTYKIAIALNALENNVISENNNIIRWNGKEYPFADWNKNQSLNSAMAYSVNWYFQNIDNKIGNSERTKFLSKINYGNKNTGLNANNYWLENSLKISPVEQVMFLKGLYVNDFGVDDNNARCVINSIKLSDGFYGKTGTGMVNNHTVNGWFLGIYEGNDDAYIFAARISADDNATGFEAKKIAENILKTLDK